MNPGRNAIRIRKRLGATATLLFLVGAAFIAAGPATAALNLGGASAGSLDALWGAYGEAAGGGEGAEGESETDMAGSVSGAWQGAADVAVTPPDPQPTIDEAAALAEEAKAKAEATVNGALAQKDSLQGAGALQWGVSGNGAGTYDVVLGGDYAGGLAGLASASGQKQLGHSVDVSGHEAAAAGATGELEGAINGLIDQVAELYSKAHASFDVGLDGATKALGSVGMDIAGIFGFQKSADIVNADSLHLDKRVDIAAPAMAFEHVDLPDLAIPDVAVDQGGEVAMDAAATAHGLVKA